MTLFPVIVGAINNALNLKINYWVLAGTSLVGGVVVLVYYTVQKKKENFKSLLHAKLRITKLSLEEACSPICF
jgi:hypothetical protein